VNDVYKRYLVKDGSTRHYVGISYGATFVLLVLGIGLGLKAESINQVTQIIVNGLWGGYAAPNVLKWYWWRFNGHGYFWGMLAGMVVAACQPLLAPDWHTLAWSPVVVAAATAASVLASLLTRPDDAGTLESFYRNVRPWGFWGPVHARIVSAEPGFEKNRDFWRDSLNVLVAIVWQFQLVTIPLFLILQRWQSLWICVAILVVTTLLLKRGWYDRLERGDEPPSSPVEAGG